MRRSRLSRGKPPRRNDRHRWEPFERRPHASSCARCGSLWLGPDPPELGCRGIKRTRVKPISPRRAEKRAKRGVYGPYHAWVGGLPCVLQGLPEGHRCAGRAVGHHVRKVGAGWNDRLPNGKGNEVPMCEGIGGAHEDVERIGNVRFSAKYGLPPLWSIAAAIGVRSDAPPAKPGGVV